MAPLEGAPCVCVGGGGEQPGRPVRRAQLSPRDCGVAFSTAATPWSGRGLLCFRFVFRALES